MPLKRFQGTVWEWAALPNTSKALFGSVFFGGPPKHFQGTVWECVFWRPSQNTSKALFDSVFLGGPAKHHPQRWAGVCVWLIRLCVRTPTVD